MLRLILTGGIFFPENLVEHRAPDHATDDAGLRPPAADEQSGGVRERARAHGRRRPGQDLAAQGPVVGSLVRPKDQLHPIFGRHVDGRVSRHLIFTSFVILFP